MKLTILGCGSSSGVPRIGGDWGSCDPKDPKNARRRGSALVEDAGTRVLIDTSPDLRAQLLDAEVATVDGVVWTHEHADQTHGIDDLRSLALNARRRVDCYGTLETLNILRRRFTYCFDHVSNTGYPPILNAHTIDGPFRIGALEIVPFAQSHGDIESLGLRCGPIGYSNDVVGLSDAAFAALAGVKVWVVDALRYEPHPSHAHLELTLSWIARLKPERAILTNMHNQFDYATLKRELPPGVEPGYDGMVIEVS
jgi:phosphoribosyl 1,2-cyclic phosphate phosphodiesterase